MNELEKLKQAAADTPRLIPDAKFWSLWKQNKKAMKAAGFQPRKTKDGWRVFFKDNEKYNVDIIDFPVEDKT